LACARTSIALAQPVEVTVVVPTRNREALLRRCIASVLAQQGPSLEVVVVDDASSDGTAAMLASVEDLRLRTIRHDPRRERAAARNAGLRAARGELVMFLDDDDHLLPRALERLSAAMRAHPEAVAAAGVRVDRYGASVGQPYPHPARERALAIWRELAAGWLLAQGQYACRTSRAREMGGWNESIATAEDVDFWLRLAPLGPVAFLTDEVVCIEHEHAARPELVHEVLPLWKRLRREFAAALPPDMAGVAQRLVEADDIADTARHAYYRGEYLACLRAYVQLFRAAPELFRSPILGRPMRTAVLRAAAGLALRKNGMRAVKSIGRKLLAR
jgi:glycosyltransferase involved in cell wall biosynthesis